MTLEEKREFFKKDRFATYKTGIIIEDACENYSRCSFEITPDDCAAHGGVMGGAVFTLADFAFAVATNSDEKLTVTVSSNIEFMGLPKDKKLIAEAKCLKDGSRACFFEINITDGLGNPVAAVMSNGMHLGPMPGGKK